ncbi:MAG: tyrosine-type recombinase/integrase [Verrucomicrobiota bacterium]|jgi:integrase
MNKSHPRSGEFRRVAENLFRYSSSSVYYARFQSNGKDISRSLRTTDRTLAKRRLADELENASKLDVKVGKMTLEELLRLYEERLGQYAPKTIATRLSIRKIFKETWPHGLNVPVHSVNTGQLELWLASRRANFKKATYNEYARFLRHLFELALKFRVIATSPAAGLKGLRVETPIRTTPTWEQFQALVADIRAQRLSADAGDSADLVEFMGLAGVGTAECTNLMGEHIDFAAKRITLYRLKTDTGYTIPIFPQLLPFLQRLQAKGQLQQGQNIFKIRDPKKSLAAACKRLNFPHFSPRSLRRCFVTRSIEVGIDFKTIASWQGHRDGGVLIAKTYSHLRSEHSDAMAQRLVVH